ncbi:hypothetical protein B0H11DRAFT_2384041 [Mycena galericulata]|nr:hypothetical protein B0H11DRAFT_2384041 [Mycena galericulata]
MQFRPPTLSPRQSFFTMSPPPPLGFPPHVFHSSDGHGGGGTFPAQTQHVPQRRGGRGGARRASGASSSYGDSGQGGELQHRSRGRDGRRGSSASDLGNTRSGEHAQPGDVGGIAPSQNQNQSQSRSGRGNSEGQPGRPRPPSFSSSSSDRRASFSPTSGRQHQHWGGAGFGAFPTASGAFGQLSTTAGFASGTAGASSFHSRPTSSGPSSYASDFRTQSTNFGRRKVELDGIRILQLAALDSELHVFPSINFHSLFSPVCRGADMGAAIRIIALFGKPV